MDSDDRSEAAGEGNESSASSSQRHEPEGGGTIPDERIVPGQADTSTLSQLYKPMSTRSTQLKSTSTATPRLDVITPGSLLDSSPETTTGTVRLSDRPAQQQSGTSQEPKSSDDQPDNRLLAVMDQSTSSTSTFSQSALDSTARMIAAATLDDGRIDYEMLKRLRRAEREKYRKRLERERTKRYALESVLMNMSGVSDLNPNEAKQDLSSASSIMSTPSTYATDTSDFLIDLIRTKVAQKRRTRTKDTQKRPESSDSSVRTLKSESGDHRQAGDGGHDEAPNVPKVAAPVPPSATQVAAEQPPPQPSSAAASIGPNKPGENYYESTSLFSVHPEPVPPSKKQTHLKDKNRYANLGGRRNDHQPSTSGHHSVPMKQSSMRSTPVPASMKQVFATSETSSKQGWWWIDVNGVPTTRIPATPHLTTGSRQHDVDLDDDDARRQTFIRRSRQRLRAIKQASQQRHALALLHREIAHKVAAGELRLEDALTLYEQPEYTHKAPRAFTRDQMELSTKKKVIKLPEYQAKQLRQARNQELATNRVCAQMYKQKLAYYRQMKQLSSDD